MAKADRAKSFWNVIKAVSVQAIAKEACTPVILAVVGMEQDRLPVLRALYADDGELAAFPEVRVFESLSPDDGFPTESGSFDVVIDAGAARAVASAGSAVYSLSQVGGWEPLVAHVLDDRPDLALSLARRFPGFREEVSRRVIRETAVANAEFAMLNALPGVIPPLAILLPTTAIGDIVILAKNQAMMLFRLAAAHNLPLDLTSRSPDLAPLLGNAFGWRALARQLVAVVPGGVGVAARGVIAYAGTVALGEALRRLYALGQKPNRAQLARLYRESLTEARDAARSIAGRLPMRRRGQLRNQR